MNLKNLVKITYSEREMLIANKRVVSVTISKHILRAETAMITALGAIGISDGK